MPNHGTHDVITLVTGAALVPLTYVALLDYDRPPDEAERDTALLVGAHLLSGIMFSPDLDIDSAIDNRWGPFYWIWRPYMWAVPHGSHLWSHGLLFPPLLRLVYFFVVSSLVFLAAWVLGHVGVVMPDYPLQVIHYMEHLVQTRPHEVEAFLAGFITGGAAHTIADAVTTRYHPSKHPHSRFFK